MKTAEIEIKKSRFIGIAIKTCDSNEVMSVLQEIKKQHKKATHVCFAYKIVNNGVEQVKYNDDGEPTGTAGRPMLSVIEKKNLLNVAVFVVRYFGGVKLGGGGLVRAYSKAASQVLEDDNNSNETSW